MKKILGICLIVLLSAGSVMAQSDRRGQRVDHTERVEKTIKDLKLNDDQAAELRKIENEHAERMMKDREEMMNDRENNRELTQAEREKRREEMQRKMNEKNERVKTILTDDQYKKYLETQRPQGPRGDRR